MSTLPTVAVAGATGNLGPEILKELLDANVHVTVLTREGSKSSSSLAAHPRQTIKTVDWESQESLVSALKGNDVVISVIASDQIGLQKRLIDAAFSAGVKRIVPSEFGCDMSLPSNRSLPVFGFKIQIQDYLLARVKEDPSVSYTFFYNNPFLDWGLQYPFLVNIREHSATLYNGGDVYFSATRLSTIGKGVAAVVTHLEDTKNQEVLIHDAALTQNQIISAIKKIDGKSWTTTVVSTDEIEQSALKKMQSPGQKSFHDLIPFIFVAIFGPNRGNDFTGRAWNKRLGVPEVPPREVEEIIQDIAKRVLESS